MKKLPFATKPQYKPVTIGTPETGQITLPSMSGLIAGEQEALDEASEHAPDPFAEASRLAIKIKAARNFPDSEILFCFAVVANSDWENEQRTAIESAKEKGEMTAKEVKEKLAALKEKSDLFAALRIEYSPDISALNRELSKANRQKRKALVGAMLRYRGSLLLKEELATLKQGFNPDNRPRMDELEAQIESLENWTDEDTNQLHSEFLDALYAFANKELNGGKEPEELTAEAVGKLPEIEPDNENESTGQTSTGDSKSSGPKTKDLALSAS